VSSPLPPAHLDFETRSKLDVRKVGALRYAEDPSTTILCLTFKIGNLKRLWKSGDPAPEELLSHIRLGGVIKAHNALFETAIWHYVCHKRYGWPSVNPRQWRCVAAKAAANSLPRALNKAGKALGLSIQKDDDGKRVMLKLSKPRKPTQNDPSIWHNNAEDFATLYAYNDTDVLAEESLDHALPDLNAFEQELWFLDQKINKRGVTIDVPTVRICVDMIDRLKARYNARISEATSGEVTAGTQTARILKWLTANGVDVADTQAPTLKPLLSGQSLSSKVRTVIAGRLAVSKTSTAKYRTMLDVVCADGKIKDILMYHGANTGRWSGKFVQFQNIPRGMIKDMEEAIELVQMEDLDLIECFYPEPMDFLSWCLRGMIIPDEGKELVVCDYSAIEARVLPWLASEEAILDLFRRNECVYCAQASNIYQRPINKNDHSQERQTGKVAELALGYQGGPNALDQMARAYGIDLTALYEPVWFAATEAVREVALAGYELRGRDSDLSRKAWLAAEIIKIVWRQDHPNTVRYWANTQKAAIRAVLTKNKVRCGKITWFVEGRFLYAELPSKRRLAYCDPLVKISTNDYGRTTETLYFWGMNTKNQWMQQHTYGGKLVENLTQAVARDVMAEAMLLVEAHPVYEIMFTVHDELVTQAPLGIGNERELERLMCTPVDWQEGLPVTAEAWKGVRYKK
jgi:DNA polymerase bacteriophage-type